MATETNAPRVAMLAHTCYLRDPRVRREAEALAQSGVEVHVIALSEVDSEGRAEPPRAWVNGVELHRLPVRRRRGSALRYMYEYLMVGILGAIKLTVLHYRRKLSVVHVHNMPDILVLAGIVPRLTGSKLVLDVHDPMPELFLSWNKNRSRRIAAWLLRLQESISVRLADRVVSVNETMRENLRSKGVRDDKLFIVHNFPDEGLFPLRDLPTAWPKSQDQLVLLYCGTVTEHYDLALAVRAIAKLRTEIPIRLKILGEGNRLSEVLDLAAKLGVRESIEPLGLVPVDKVRHEMKDADIGISCHRAGVFGDLYFSTKIIEYLTQSLPVLSPRTYTIAKYIPDSCMFYFEASEEALVESLRYMYRNPSEVLVRLSNARELLPRFSWQSERGRFVAFYSDLVGNPARKAGAVAAK